MNTIEARANQALRAMDEEFRAGRITAAGYRHQRRRLFNGVRQTLHLTLEVTLRLSKTSMDMAAHENLVGTVHREPEQTRGPAFWLVVAAGIALLLLGTWIFLQFVVGQ